MVVKLFIITFDLNRGENITKEDLTRVLKELSLYDSDFDIKEVV
jgi:hypothetical protein